ncbi:MAG: hypothetical protein Q7R79_04305 [bacterium]|nr:hypothetical protein [bacterium]
MTYCFILGRVPSLSLLEIHAVLLREEVLYSSFRYSPEIFIIKTDSVLDLPTLQRNIGGTIKTAMLYDEEIEATKQDAIVSALCKLLLSSVSKPNARITFGLSAYTLSRGDQKVSKRILSSKTLKSIGLKIKKQLRSDDYSIRFVSAEPSLTLSSVQSVKNGLLDENGKEYILLEDGKKIRIGSVETVQEFEEYSFRDWQRPHHEMETGLLPPKVAQVMINLSGLKPEKGTVLLDPFCGFGTVLQEALLMGFSTVRGSDIDQKNVRATQENLTWLSGKKSVSFEKDWVIHCDAATLTSCYQKNSIDAIITEPYLGPIITRERTGSLKAIAKELSQLYIRFFREAFQILKKNGVIVMVWPVWMDRDVAIFLPLVTDVLGIGYENKTIPQGLAAILHEKTARGSLLYHRPGQFVARELFVFQKK